MFEMSKIHEWDNGKKQCVTVTLPDIVKRNMVHKYYQWLDFALYKRIKSGLPRRLYEYLEKIRYHKQNNTLTIGIDKLCRWLPMIRHVAASPPT